MEFILKYTGEKAKQHELDLYDAAYAMLGFQRSLAITTHLILNNEIITKAPSLKNAQILSTPPKVGSWEISASIVLGSIIVGAQTGVSDIIKHLIFSAYDAVVHRIFGFYVDLDKSLFRLHQEHKKELEMLKMKEIRTTQIDDAALKCESGIKDMHKPIIYSKTADKAYSFLSSNNTFDMQKSITIDKSTFESLQFKHQSDEAVIVVGKVADYRMNTYSGTIYIADEQRVIPFQLAKECKSQEVATVLAESLFKNIQGMSNSKIKLLAYKTWGKNKLLKSLYVIEVSYLECEMDE